MVYRYCMVPQCRSTTVATPSKTFISVPLEKNKRKIWLKAARRDPKDISAKSNIWICEDHFNVSKLDTIFLKVIIKMNKHFLQTVCIIDTKQYSFFLLKILSQFQTSLHDK